MNAVTPGQPPLPATFDAVVVGGGPSGATAAHDLARRGWSVMLLDRAGRIKPCGGAVPPQLLREFDVPEKLLVARIRSARIIAPSNRTVDMPIDGNGYVGMVDRDVFDEWLRRRAAGSGAVRQTGTFERIDRDPDGMARVVFREARGGETGAEAATGREIGVRARCVIGADGAIRQVARQEVPGADKVRHVFAYHEIVATPAPDDPAAEIDPRRCDVFYNGTLSPDFYAWIFPHGETLSVGTGSARKGFSLRGSVAELRAMTGLGTATTVRREGAPIPMKPLRRWDNGRDVVLAGDAAGVVAPASGEGIYYAMLGGRLSADAADAFLATGDARVLAQARRRFMKLHGRVFWVLGWMQRVWYVSDWRRERFVSMCKDRDVQRLTWEAYMNKALVRRDPLAHVRIFFKDMGQLLGLVRP
jgi:geranylgeranyl reductase